MKNTLFLIILFISTLNYSQNKIDLLKPKLIDKIKDAFNANYNERINEFSWKVSNEEREIYNFLESDSLYAQIDTILYPNDKEIIVAINSFEKSPLTNYKYDCHGCSPYLNLIKLSNENNTLELIESKRNITRYGSWGNPAELELIKINDSIYFISINENWYDMLFYYEFKRIYCKGILQLIIQTAWEGEVSISEAKTEKFSYKSNIEINKNDLMLIIKKEGTNYIQDKNKIVEINEINKYVFDLKDELLYQIDNKH